MAHPRRIVVNGMQKCTICKVEKPLADFYKNKSCANGYEATCKECVKIKHTNLYATEAYKKRNRERMRLYGMSRDDYDKFLILQKNCCAICGRPQKEYFVKTRDGKKHYLTSLTVDHDHKTMKIRGLLCRNCNLAIGLLEDNTKYLASAIRYLLSVN